MKKGVKMIFKGSSKNTYKGPMDKAKGGQDSGWEMGVAGMGNRQMYLNINFKNDFKKENFKKLKSGKKKIIFMSVFVFQGSHTNITDWVA